MPFLYMSLASPISHSSRKDLILLVVANMYRLEPYIKNRESAIRKLSQFLKSTRVLNEELIYQRCAI